MKIVKQKKKRKNTHFILKGKYVMQFNKILLTFVVPEKAFNEVFALTLTTFIELINTVTFT